MKHEQRLDIDCPECNQKYTILYSSKETIEFCCFCGELIVKSTDDQEEFDDEDLYADDEDLDEQDEW